MRSAIQPLDTDALESSRISCHQCGVMTYPHSVCRCITCGLRHANDPGCRSVPCDQCGLSSAPHKACRCRHCHKIHTKRSGCRNLSTRIIRRLPDDRQREVLNSRLNCHQCGQYTFAHSSCRCRTCGRFHSIAANCVPSADIVAATLAVCPQCQVESYPHRSCMCHRCCIVHMVDRPCPVRIGTNASLRRAAIATGNRAVPVHDAGFMLNECNFCGARSWTSESIRCCSYGAVQLQAYPEVPHELSSAILAPHVRQHMRAYNMSMAMASVGHENRSLPDGDFVLGGRSSVSYTHLTLPTKRIV